ncbi:MAG: SAM-dependent methyltransferase, partial [Thermoleophilia bacterium]
MTVVGTPIGNLDDLSPRAASALRAADVVACEDTRRTAVLLRHAGATAPMLALHAHNEAARTAELCARMAGGARVALVTDAGMPVVSDPGARLVRAGA